MLYFNAIFKEDAGREMNCPCSHLGRAQNRKRNGYNNNITV